MSHLGTIPAGDTRFVDVTVSPSSALDGARVQAEVWRGAISTATTIHSWDTDDPDGIEVDTETGVVSLAFGDVAWGTLSRPIEAELQVRVTRGGSTETRRYTIGIEPTRPE